MFGAKITPPRTELYRNSIQSIKTNTQSYIFYTGESSSSNFSMWLRRTAKKKNTQTQDHSPELKLPNQKGAPTATRSNNHSKLLKTNFKFLFNRFLLLTCFVIVCTTLHSVRKADDKYLFKDSFDSGLAYRVLDNSDNKFPKESLGDLAVHSKNSNVEGETVETEQQDLIVVLAMHRSGTSKGSVWEDLDLSYAVTCGGFKCFVRSVSDKKIGYLIARDISIFDDMMKAMQLAKELKHMYGAKHFYIEPPYNASMPAETMAQLNTVAQQPLKELAQRHDFFSLPSVIVQKMKTAETPSLFFACFHPNYRITSANLPSFLSLVVETGDKEEFEINIAKERKILRSMLQDVPGFGADIQALVSTKGEFFYIDLDAHMYWSHRRNSVFRNGVPLEKCEEKFDAIDRVLRKTTLDAATAYS